MYYLIMVAGVQGLTGDNSLTPPIFLSADPEKKEGGGSIEDQNQEYQNNLP
jgi:hypothetical protein